jgi:hypothetical protein
MSYYGIRMCDFCGKRTEEIAGHLKLTKKAQWRDSNQMYKRDVGVRSWGLCKNCLKKLTNLESLGDKIKEDIELKLDQIRVNNTPFKILEDMRGQEK